MRETLADGLDAFDLECTLSFRGAKSVGLDLRGTKLTYDPEKEMLTVGNVTAPAKMTARALESAHSGRSRVR